MTQAPITRTIVWNGGRWVDQETGVYASNLGPPTNKELGIPADYRGGPGVSYVDSNTYSGEHTEPLQPNDAHERHIFGLVDKYLRDTGSGSDMLVKLIDARIEVAFRKMGRWPV
jgi:hypothetical protein